MNITIPEWQTDDSANQCTSCKEGFSIFRWKVINHFFFLIVQHHCRACGLIFCGNCSSSRVHLSVLGYGEPVRVCTKCLRAGNKR